MKRALLFAAVLLFVAFAAVEVARSVSPAGAQPPDISPREVQIFRGAAVTPEWQELLLRARENGWEGHLNGSASGVRTFSQQKKLWRKFRSGKGAPAFPPNGPSRHLQNNVDKRGSWSQAVDVSKPRDLVRAARKEGVVLHQPYLAEPWHIEATRPFSLSLSASVVPAVAVQRAGFSVVPVALLQLALLASLLLLFLGVKQSRFLLAFLLPLGAPSLLLSSPLYAASYLLLVLLLAPFLARAFLARSDKRTYAKASREMSPSPVPAGFDAVSWNWPSR